MARARAVGIAHVLGVASVAVPSRARTAPRPDSVPGMCRSDVQRGVPDVVAVAGEGSQASRRVRARLPKSCVVNWAHARSATLGPTTPAASTADTATTTSATRVSRGDGLRRSSSRRGEVRDEAAHDSAAARIAAILTPSSPPVPFAMCGGARTARIVSAVAAAASACSRRPTGAASHEHAVRRRSRHRPRSPREYVRSRTVAAIGTTASAAARQARCIECAESEAERHRSLRTMHSPHSSSSTDS